MMKFLLCNHTTFQPQLLYFHRTALTPGTLSRVLLNTTGESSLVLTWAPPTMGGAPVNYTLTINDSRSPVVIPDNGSPVYNYTFTGLTSNTMYSVSVMASNDGGNGNQTVVNSCTCKSLDVYRLLIGMEEFLNTLRTYYRQVVVGLFITILKQLLSIVDVIFVVLGAYPPGNVTVDILQGPDILPSLNVTWTAVVCYICAFYPIIIHLISSSRMGSAAMLSLSWALFFRSHLKVSCASVQYAKRSSIWSHHFPVGGHSSSVWHLITLLVKVEQGDAQRSQVCAKF